MSTTQEFVLVRFANVPNPAVTAYLQTVVSNRPDLVLGPGMIITAFKSESKYEDLVEGFDALDIKYSLIKKSVIVGSAASIRPDGPESIASLKRKLVIAVESQNFEEASRIQALINIHPSNQNPV